MPLPSSAALAGRTRNFRGAPQAKQTLKLMCRVVQEEFRLPLIVEVGVNIAASVREKDDAAKARALLRWLRAHTRYVDDPIDQQMLKTPAYMLDLIRRDGVTGGDCVDVAMLAAALAASIGMEPRFIAEGYAPPDDPMHADLTHVYTVVQVGGVWVNFDTQRTPTEADTRPVRREEINVLDE